MLRTVLTVAACLTPMYLLVYGMCRAAADGDRMLRRPWQIEYFCARNGHVSVRGHYATRADAETAIRLLEPKLPQYILRPTRGGR